MSTYVTPMTIEELERKIDARFAELLAKLSTLSDGMHAVAQSTIEATKLSVAADVEAQRALPLERLRQGLAANCYQTRLRASAEKGYSTTESSPNSHMFLASLAVADADALLAALARPPQ